MSGKHRGIRVAVDLGRKAALAGQPKESCPYQPSRYWQADKWRKLWLEGYDSVKGSVKK